MSCHITQESNELQMGADLLASGTALSVGTLGKKATIHQVTTMPSTPKNVLFPGHNHLLTTGANDLTL